MIIAKNEQTINTAKLTRPVVSSSVSNMLLLNNETGKLYAAHQTAQTRKSLIFFCRTERESRLINGRIINRLTNTGKLPIRAKRATTTPNAQKPILKTIWYSIKLKPNRKPVKNQMRKAMRNVFTISIIFKSALNFKVKVQKKLFY